MSDVTGTIRKVVLDGITFDAMGAANIKETGSGWENDVIVTSGRNIRKMTKRAETREGIDIAANGTERELLQELAERMDDFPMSYETAAGDVYRCVGWIEFEARETEESKATIKMFPRDTWESFLSA
ncbi:MAG: hypothetical protein GY874_02685 [Desulfobacteraceae bacterium]|nr:hypothetical protein [Desulfobacteraceae bacterium]